MGCELINANELNQNNVKTTLEGGHTSGYPHIEHRPYLLSVRLGTNLFRNPALVAGHSIRGMFAPLILCLKIPIPANEIHVIGN